MLRFSLALLAAFALGAAEISPAPDLVAELASDLSQGEIEAIMAHFDRAMPGYERIHRDIAALSSREVGCSIMILKDDGDQRRRTLELDWILEVSGSRRRVTVHAAIEPRGGRRWLVTSLEPLDLFTPPQ
ncbi:MAG TPA: hypothetical protein VF767_12560 [Bryobacteraceae bacterium]